MTEGVLPGLSVIDEPWKYKSLALGSGQLLDTSFIPSLGWELDA